MLTKRNAALIFILWMFFIISIALGQEGEGDSPWSRTPGDLSTIAPPQDSIFTREQVSSRVWVIYGRGGNVGVVVGEDGVLVIDTQFKKTAPGLLRQIRQITNNPIRYIINTHVHGDHVGGNSVFQEYGEIIAHRNTYERLLEKYHISGERRRREGLPHITFQEELRIQVGGVEIRAFHFERGHTDTDVVVWIPSEKVVHVGDLLFNKIIPYVDMANGAHTLGWIESLMRIYNLIPPETRVIAGHGKVSDREGLRQMADYFRTIRAAVERAHREGKSKSQILGMKFDQFASWSGQRRLRMSLEAAYTEIVGNGPTLLVVNKSENTVAFVDVPTTDVRGKAPTGPNPHEVAVTPDGRLAYVSNYGSGRPSGSRCWLTVIDVSAMRTVRDLELKDPHTGKYLSAPHGILITPDGKSLWVTVEGNQAVVRIALPEEKIAAMYPTRQQVSHQVVSLPDGSKAYVANIGSGSVSVVDVATGKVKTIPCQTGTEGIDVSPDSRWVWAVNRGANSISVIDTRTDTVVATLRAGAFPIRVKFTPDNRYALVSNARDGNVAVYGVQSRKLMKTISTGSMPVGLLILPDGSRAYVANTQSDRVSVLDLQKWQVVGLIRPGKEPDGLGLSIPLPQPVH